MEIWTDLHLDKASHPFSSELTQPHSKYSLRLISSRCAEKRFERLFVSTAIQMHGAPCNSGFSLSQHLAEGTLLTVSINRSGSFYSAPVCLHSPHPLSFDLLGPLRIYLHICIGAETSGSFSHNVQTLLLFMIIIRLDNEGPHVAIKGLNMVLGNYHNNF